MSNMILKNIPQPIQHTWYCSRDNSGESSFSYQDHLPPSPHGVPKGPCWIVSRILKWSHLLCPESRLLIFGIYCDRRSLKPQKILFFFSPGSSYLSSVLEVELPTECRGSQTQSRLLFWANFQCRWLLQAENPIDYQALWRWHVLLNWLIKSKVSF